MRKYVNLSICLLLAVMFTNRLSAQRFQAIHNSADPQLAVMDLYILYAGNLLDKVEDIPFRSAAPYITIPLPGLPLDFGIAPGNSTSVSDTVKSFRQTFASGETYVGMINGVIDPGQFAPNPDGRDIALDAFINENARETSTVAGEVQFFFVHGVTDVPTVDVVVRGGSQLIDNAAYGEISGYVSLTPNSYVFDLTDESGANTLISFDVDLSGYADSALVVYLSGFREPSQNQNGEGWGLFGASPGGTDIQFPEVPTGLRSVSANQKISGYRLKQNYPNPFNSTTVIRYQLAVDSQVELAIYNLLGQQIRTLVNATQPAGTHRVHWDGRDSQGNQVSNGLYFYRLQAGPVSQSRQMLLLK